MPSSLLPHLSLYGEWAVGSHAAESSRNKVNEEMDGWCLSSASQDEGHILECSSILLEAGNPALKLSTS